MDKTLARRLRSRMCSNCPRNFCTDLEVQKKELFETLAKGHLLHRIPHASVVVAFSYDFHRSMQKQKTRYATGNTFRLFALVPV